MRSKRQKRFLSSFGLCGIIKYYSSFNNKRIDARSKIFLIKIIKH